MAHKLKLGDRVRVKDSLLYTDRVGILRGASGEEDDFWDYTVELEACPVPEGSTRGFAMLCRARTIGVYATQVEAA